MTEHDQAVTAAHRFYGLHAAEHLARDHQRLVDRCGRHLADLFGLPASRATDIAMQVAGEIDSGHADGFIDHERSTSSCVVLRDTAFNRVHMVSARELLALARNRAAAPPG